MKLVDLFCGTGGFSRGAHLADFDVAAAYDLDKILTSSYETNHPGTLLKHRDVGTLTSSEVSSHVAGEICGIIGGPPCQGFSDIGRREPNDPRRQLLGHFFRLASQIKPAFFVMENVLGLTHAHSSGVLNEAIDEWAGAYRVSDPIILNAADFGAATSRKRVFLVGLHRDFATDFREEMLAPFRKPAATVRQAIADLSGALDLGQNEDGFDQWKITKRGAVSSYAKALRGRDRTFTGHIKTKHTDKVIERFSTVAPGKMDRVGRHPRLKWEGQCPTLRAGTGSDKGSYQSVRPIHPTENRVITVREAARLQGFPDHHIFHPTTWHSFRMIGNSVSPMVAEAVLRSVAEALKLTDQSRLLEAAE